MSLNKAITPRRVCIDVRAFPNLASVERDYVYVECQH